MLSAIATALLIAAVGRLGSLPVWVLALAGGAISYSIAHRNGSEPATVDPTATLLKVAFILVLCGAAFDNREPHIDVLHPSPAAWFAFVLIASGLYLRRRAMATLGALFSIKVVVHDDHRLVDGGPYRTIRHPNYSGLVLVMLGTAIGLESPLAFAAVVLVWLPALLARIRHEESALGLQLGEEYARYAARTWRLVPGVY